MSSLSHTSGLVLGRGGATPYGGPSGQTFYVNPNATGLARSVGRPWYDSDGATVFGGVTGLQGAIDACVADRGDVIYMARGYWQPTTPILFNKQGITLIGATWGMSPRARGEYFTIDSTDATGPTARITKGCHIVGIGFAGVQSSGDDYTATVQIDGSGASTDGYGTWLQDCRFINWDRAAVEHGIVNKGAANTRVENCYFSGGAATNILDAGILHDESSTGGGGRPGEMDVIGCYFEHCEYAMEVVSGSRVVNSVWDRNIMGFQAVGDVWVKFLKLNVLGGGAAVHGAHITNNNFATGVDTGTFSHSLSDLTTEGYQLSGNSYAGDLGHLS